MHQVFTAACEIHVLEELTITLGAQLSKMNSAKNKCYRQLIDERLLSWLRNALGKDT